MIKNLIVNDKKETKSSIDANFFIDLIQSPMKKCCGDCKNNGNCNKGQSNEAHSNGETYNEQNKGN
ncbi:MAG: hypothetical protein IPK03_16450 [Bacteroidetes bacterium]|nr:hypothetical protein [Bacteroidota bacterium]MBP7477738.1 hypothetical protein [Chitinophagales bacterium]